MRGGYPPRPADGRPERGYPVLPEYPALAQKPPDASLDFLNGDPTPVGVRSTPSQPPAVLPQRIVDDLMRIAGVDGVWVEQDPRGTPVVVLHYSPAGPTAHLPTRVQGMPTRVVGGEPIRAL
jgi:hypothetical protein